MKDIYSVLGVSRQASPNKITLAFKNLYEAIRESGRSMRSELLRALSVIRRLSVFSGCLVPVAIVGLLLSGDIADAKGCRQAELITNQA